MNGKLAVIGCGNWGKNLVRIFCQLLGAEQVICCDPRNELVQSLTEAYPGVGTTTNVDHIWEDSSVMAVAIATPVLTHYPLAQRALLTGLHAFVEKPMTTNTAEAAELCDLAERENRVLMVDHLLLFHPAIKELGLRIAAGDLGDIYHLYSRRTNLGIVRSEENVLWSLGPHDVAVMLELVGQSPVRVAASGGIYLQPQLGLHDVVFVTLVFPRGQLGHLHLSWHDPQKIRQITVVGSRKTAVFEDSGPEEKLRLYDIDVDSPSGDGMLSLRSGDPEVPTIPAIEPLVLACQRFLDSVDRDRALLSTGRTGLEVVRILEAAQASLDKAGAPVLL